MAPGSLCLRVADHLVSLLAMVLMIVVLPTLLLFSLLVLITAGNASSASEVFSVVKALTLPALGIAALVGVSAWVSLCAILPKDAAAAVDRVIPLGKYFRIAPKYGLIPIYLYLLPSFNWLPSKLKFLTEIFGGQIW